jgi:hypothetical protein
MAYEYRHLRRQKVRYNSANDDNPLIYQLVLDGVGKVTPTSATITIYAPGNSTALVSAAAMTVTGSLLTYVVPTTTTASWPIDSGYRADIIVTYATKTYDRTVVFDVARFVLDLGIGRDQLVALDPRLNGADHAGDETFAPLIGAVRDELQALIESHVVDGGRLLENMILDQSRVSPAAINLILARYWRGRGELEMAGSYQDTYDALFMAALSSISYDTDQDGEESGTMGGLQTMRLTT